MTNTYDIGDRVRCTGTFTDINDTPADPDVVRFKFKPPSNVITTYIFGTDAQLVKSGTGVYYVELDVDTEAFWWYRFEGEAVGGDNQGAEETKFRVRPSEFD